MSSCKAAIVNISSMLGSIEGAKESYATYPFFSYRVSKVSTGRTLKGFLFLGGSPSPSDSDTLPLYFLLRRL